MPAAPAGAREGVRRGGISPRVAAFGATMRLVLVGLAASLACVRAPGGATKSVTPTATPPRAPEPAQVPVETAPKPAPIHEPAEPVEATARLLAEVEAMEVAARWTWAIATMPELAEHREAGPASAQWAELRRLAAGRSTLWVRARGERCLSVRGAWDDEGFAGRAREVVEIEGDVKTVRYELIDITERGISASGPHGETFSRDARGRWQSAGGYGLGSFATIVDRPIFEVARKAAYYGATTYTLKIECSETNVQEEHCTDGTTRRCSQCVAVRARRYVPGLGTGTTGVFRTNRQVDCSLACPPDLHTPQLAALNLAVQGRTFVTAEAPGAAVYTDARACRDDRRMRRAASDEAGPM
ncbi:hypothetical protein [Nannocystis punicea]|uniref:Lipoprotein n=1 Tax=Nannocystis punicea TaxID=2995304 RepID=A0ABY7HC52_9BACT|nr:hypothetical protein [Nannocystis poenicansa]WAS96693.1 hypothetical protein O0S08_11130 [Nannocystis poenicansa]